MNQRIIELAEQAGYNGHYATEDFDVEYFAELIVQECGVVLSPMLRDMISRGQAYELIKEHFGVK